jgi:hypothetical protein
MPDGYLVSVGVKADFSQLKSEQKEAVASMQDFAARGAAALEAFQAAAKESGAAATFLNTQLKDLAAANVAVVPAMEQAVAALKQLQAAKAADAAASKAAAASTREMSQQASVASMNMRVLEGSTMGAARAAGQFAVQSLGLGSVLGSGFAAAAFGAVGLGMIVVSLGEKLYTAFDIGGEGARKLAEDIRSDIDSMRMQNDSLDVQIDKEQIAIEKLEHKPVSGVKLAIDEAIEEVDKLDAKLDADLKKAEAVVKEMAADTTKQVLTTGMGGTGTAYEQTMVSEHARHLSEAKTAQDQLNESTSFFASLQIRLNQLKGWQSGEKDGAPGIETNFANEIAATEHLMKVQELEQAHIEKTIQLQKLQGEHGAIPPKPPKEPHEKAVNYEDILAAQQLEQGKSLGATVMYWEEVVRTTNTHHEQLLRAEEAFQKEISEKGKIKPMLAKSQVGPEPAPLPPDFMEHKETEAEADERINKALEAKIRLNASDYESTMRVAELRRRMGQISEAEAEREKLGASQTEQNKDVSALQARQKSIAPMGPIGLDTKELAEWQELQDQITAATEKGVKERQIIEDQDAMRIQQVYTKALASVTGPLNTFTDHWLQSGQRMGVAFQKMYDQMAMQAINALLKMGEKWAAHELLITVAHARGIATRKGADAASDSTIFAALMAKLGWHIGNETATTAAHVTANTAKTTSDAASAAASTAVTSATNVAQAASFTAVASMGAASAVAPIPIVGPALAAAAAAAMTGMGAAYTSMAAFASGADYIPRTGVAMLHSGEAVATAGENSRISQVISMAQNGGQGGGGPQFHYSPNISGIDGASVESMARTHGNTFMRQAQRQLRLQNKI